MGLKPGTRLGPYEITASIGAGGMGEVYRARDTRLERTVAVKVLAPHLADNQELLQRFEREARAVSSLSHPHICTLYDVGKQDGVRFLVMEHLEGETLARRLEREPLSPDETLRYASQIADALDKAHRQGVVHRDLKPGNIMLTRGGAKLLDFGLAKSAETEEAASSLSAAPTGTSPLTAEGTILGTWQYMAPEQLEGKEADARTDIFAFGAVVYEMLTGRKAFEGKSQASLIGAIMRGEPRPPSTLADMTPPALERLVLTCLAKNPDDRRQTARDVYVDLEWIARGAAEAPVAAVGSRGRPWPWMAATAGLALAAAVLGWLVLASKPGERRPVTLSFTMPHAGDDALYLEEFTISPDGRAAVFIMYNVDGGHSLWMRELGAAKARVLPGTEGASSPFWSPDSRSLGFFAEGKLKKIGTAGGPPQVLCAVADPYGGTWNKDGLILFGNGETGSIDKIPASGGTPDPVTRLDPKYEAHRWPAFLPDGKHFVLLIDAETTEDHHLGVGSLDSQEVTPLFNMISNVMFAAPDYLLFGRAGTLIAQPFDTKTLRPVGEPIPLAQNLVAEGHGHLMEFSASDTGILTYRSADLDARLTWVDLAGRPLEALGETGRFDSIALSPDQSQAAFAKRDSDGRIGDLWTLDLARNVTSRLTFHPGAAKDAQWSPDGTTIAYSSAHEGSSRIYTKPMHGGVQEKPLFGTGNECMAESFSPDGHLLMVSCFSGGNTDLWAVPVDDPETAKRITSTPFNEAGARFSPDGRWFSYQSDETGREEVYVVDYPAMARRMLVSNGGGAEAQWRADGKELYYVDNRNRLTAVTITYGEVNGIGASAPRALFTLPGNSYAAAADGQRFLVDLPAEDSRTQPITVVLDWTASLPRR